MGRAGEVHKKKSRKGKLKEKNSCTPINPKKYSCYGLKKIHTRNLRTKKIPAARKFPSLPHNFSNGPSLNLGKTFLPISRIPFDGLLVYQEPWAPAYTEYSSGLNLGEGLCIFTSFHFPHSGLFLFFYFDLFWMAWHWKPAIGLIKKFSSVTPGAESCDGHY